MEKRNLTEYLHALKDSNKYGPQVVWTEEVAGSDAVFSHLDKPWPLAMQTIVDAGGCSHLYRHQAQAINAIRGGKSVVVATPTASGKSMVYNLPVFEKLLLDKNAHALYLFPLKALAQDQLKTIEKMVSFDGREKIVTASIYDGDTSAYFRKKIREMPPQILITNPDMLHLSLLGYHEQWGSFWQGLHYVVLDEVHTYRGVFGSHMAWVLRRLKRICGLYDVKPTFICSSATVGNPGDLAKNLTGESFVQEITESGAPKGASSFVFLNPFDSPAYAASQLLEAALKRGIRTIVYTQSRKLTELVSLWTSERLGNLQNKLSSYRAGFLPEERREIEAKLSSGELLGVVSTSALELGIDIGELELCLLVGYPGSIMATWQRGGRVGRRQVPSAIVLIAQEDALDQHFMRNPQDFFRRDVEAAVLNPDNQEVIKRHLLCAAAEAPLGAEEEMLSSSAVHRALKELQLSGELLLSADGSHWFTVRKYPHRQVNIRGSGRSFLLKNTYTQEVVGEVDGMRCPKECHPGAVYLQRGASYLVDSLDLDGQEVLLHPEKVGYFTRVMSRKDTEIIEIFETKEVRGFQVSVGRLRVTDQVSGFQKRSVRGHKLLATERLQLPPQVFETEGIWIHLPPILEQESVAQKLHFMGGIHALEHAAIGIFPLLVLCDRNDVGGISIPFHPQVQSAAVFIYDGHSGGIGLSREAFLQIEKLVTDTYTTVSSCPCETGCPSCVHSPKCGSGNRPIDKEAALFLLERLLDPARIKAKSSKTQDGIPAQQLSHKRQQSQGLRKDPGHYAVFDVETKFSAAEVGGWHRADRMGVSAAVLYDSKEDRFFTYWEADVADLVDHLSQVDLVVGFNNKRFDNLVLSAYTPVNLHDLPSCDILEEVQKRLGYRLSLDRLAQHTLGAKKTADGLQALQWYKEGRLEEIATYCQQDVRITRDLFLFGLREEYFLFKNKAGHMVRCPFHPQFDITKSKA